MDGFCNNKTIIMYMKSLDSVLLYLNLLRHQNIILRSFVHSRFFMPSKSITHLTLHLLIVHIEINVWCLLFDNVLLLLCKYYLNCIKY